MKILYVNTYSPPNYVGGTERSLEILIDLFSVENDVFLATIDHESKYEKHFMLPCSRGKGSRISSYFNIRAYIAFKKILSQINPDVVHTNNLYYLSPLIWIATKRKRIKLIHTIRDEWMIFTYSKCTVKLLTKLMRLYFRFFTHFVDVVTAPSKYTLDKFEKYNMFKNAEKKAIYNVIGSNSSDRIVKEGDVANIIPHSNKINFFYIGTLVNIKGIHWLVECFNSFSKDNPETELIIAGEGVLKDLIVKYTKTNPHIHYIGFVDGAEKENVFRSIDVVIVPSLWDEPFGRVVLEAYLYDKPVIATRSGGLMEIVIDKKTGLLINKNKDKELIDAMLFLKEKDNRDGMKKNIREELSKYSFSYQKELFENLYIT